MVIAISYILQDPKQDLKIKEAFCIFVDTNLFKLLHQETKKIVSEYSSGSWSKISYSMKRYNLCTVYNLSKINKNPG